MRWIYVLLERSNSISTRISHLTAWWSAQVVHMHALSFSPQRMTNTDTDSHNTGCSYFCLIQMSWRTLTLYVLIVTANLTTTGYFIPVGNAHHRLWLSVSVRIMHQILRTIKLKSVTQATNEQSKLEYLGTKVCARDSQPSIKPKEGLYCLWEFI